MAVLPSDLFQPAVPLSLIAGDIPVEVVSNFQYLGNIVQDNRGSTSEVDARICKASKAFASLNCIPWYQRKIKTHTKLRILNSVIIPTLLYGLECVGSPFTNKVHTTTNIFAKTDPQPQIDFLAYITSSCVICGVEATYGWMDMCACCVQNKHWLESW